jgi:tetratricopeptide (TPR) repeat protein
MASALCYLERDYERAAETVSRMLALNPSDPSGWYLKAEALSQLEREDEMLPCIVKAIELGGDVRSWQFIGRSTSGYLRAAWFGWRAGRWDFATVATEEALRLDGASAQGLYLRGVLLSGRQRHDEAADALASSAALRPTFVDGWVRLGQQLFDAGKFEAARDRLDESPLRDDPAVRAVRDRAARFADLAEDLPRILSGARTPEGAAEAYDFAVLCHRRGEHGAAVRLFREAFEGGADLPRYAAARAAVLAGETDLGLAWLRRAHEDVLEKNGPARVRHWESWRVDPAFAAVREGDAVPDAWRAFRDEIDRLVAEATTPAPLQSPR